MQHGGITIDALIDALADKVAARVADLVVEMMADRLDQARPAAGAGSAAARLPGRMAMNEREAAARLGVSVQLLRKWRASGKGPHHVKLGKCVRYSIEDIVSYLRSRQAGGGQKECTPIGASQIQ